MIDKALLHHKQDSIPHLNGEIKSNFGQLGWQNILLIYFAPKLNLTQMQTKIKKIWNRNNEQNIAENEQITEGQKIKKLIWVKHATKWKSFNQLEFSTNASVKKV